MSRSDHNRIRGMISSGMVRSLFLTLEVALLGIISASCGALGTGTTATGVDARPNGDIIAQGNLSGLNGTTASGAVLAYRETGTDRILIRLEGLSISPTENSFKILGEASGGSDYSGVLRFVQGNANYTTGLYYPSTVTRVILESFTKAPLREVASAQLISP